MLLIRKAALFVLLGSATICFAQTPKQSMNVVKISTTPVEASVVPALLDEAGVTFQPVANANWEAFPYRPEVQFRLAYTGQALLLHFQVKEASVRARYGVDNEAVWTDSCVEFFSIPGGDGVYYNLECNCIGTLLMGAGATRSGREHAPQEVLSKVLRWASLGREPFDERVGETEWQVALVIPYTVFFKHHITSLDGKSIRANFYKCGDELQTPHYLSWNPIQLPKPNFHVPEFFGTLNFE